jgi:GGDEF domain-containing protein
MGKIRFAPFAHRAPATRVMSVSRFAGLSPITRFARFSSRASSLENPAKRGLVMRNFKTTARQMKTTADNRQLIDFFNGTEKETIFCLLDIDDFTTFNLLNSYEKGDTILNQLSDTIKQIPALNNLTRVDSDEFLFSCFGNFEINKKNLFLLMQTIQSELKITVSIGVTERNSFTTSSEFILSKLRRGLLTAKDFGKNKLHFD